MAMVAFVGFNYLVACGTGSDQKISHKSGIGGSNEDEEDDIEAERPSIISGSYLACIDQGSFDSFKKIICKISDKIDLKNIDLENLMLEVNGRLIPIKVTSSGNFEIVVKSDETVKSDSKIHINHEQPTLSSADQLKEPKRRKKSHLPKSDETNADETKADETKADETNADETNPDDSTMPSNAIEMPQEFIKLPNEIETQALTDGLSSDKGITIAGFIDGQTPSIIHNFDQEYQSNTFSLFGDNVEGANEVSYGNFVLPDFTKPTVFRVETHNTFHSDGVVLKINDLYFGGDISPQRSYPDLLFSTANSTLDQITTLTSMKLIFSNEANEDDQNRIWQPDPECLNIQEDSEDLKSQAFTVKFIELTDEGEKVFGEISLYSDLRNCAPSSPETEEPEDNELN